MVFAVCEVTLELPVGERKLSTKEQENPSCKFFNWYACFQSDS